MGRDKEQKAAIKKLKERLTRARGVMANLLPWALAEAKAKLDEAEKKIAEDLPTDSLDLPYGLFLLEQVEAQISRNDEQMAQIGQMLDHLQFYFSSEVYGLEKQAPKLVAQARALLPNVQAKLKTALGQGYIFPNVSGNIAEVEQSILASEGALQYPFVNARVVVQSMKSAVKTLTETGHRIDKTVALRGAVDRKLDALWSRQATLYESLREAGATLYRLERRYRAVNFERFREQLNGRVKDLHTAAQNYLAEAAAEASMERQMFEQANRLLGEAELCLNLVECEIAGISELENQLKSPQASSVSSQQQ